MSKITLFAIVLVAAVAFGTADYYLNQLSFDLEPERIEEAIPAQPNIDGPRTPVINQSPVHAAAMPALASQFSATSMVEGFALASQQPTKQIFEKIDLSNLQNVSAYQNSFKKLTSEEDSSSIELYEIVGPASQGGLTYLNVKLQFIAQIEGELETINENGAFGENSFFFNNQNYPDTAFLVVQIGNSVLGFQYHKNQEGLYDEVQSIIKQLTENSNLNS